MVVFLVPLSNSQFLKENFNFKPFQKHRYRAVLPCQGEIHPVGDTLAVSRDFFSCASVMCTRVYWRLEVDALSLFFLSYLLKQSLSVELIALGYG